MSYENLTLEREGHVALLTLNRPKKMNALSQDLMAELRESLDEVNQDEEIRCLVITGSGEQAFCTGFDLSVAPATRGTDEVRAHVKLNFETFLRIWNLRIPVISAVNGYAMAAGSNLALVCDVVVAAESAKFGEPEIRHYALSPMLLQPWFNGNPKMVNYLYYTGDTITAAQALEYGLVAKVVPDDELMTEALRMARRIALVGPYAVQMTKDSIRQAYELMGFRQGLEYHRANDTLVIGATGIEDKDKYRKVRQDGGMRAFIELRDGPFSEDQ